MKHSNATLSASSRIVPPDSMLQFGYSPNGGIEFDSVDALLSFSYDGSAKVDIGPAGLMVREGDPESGDGDLVVVQGWFEELERLAPKP